MKIHHQKKLTPKDITPEFLQFLDEAAHNLSESPNIENWGIELSKAIKDYAISIRNGAQKLRVKLTFLEEIEPILDFIAHNFWKEEQEFLAKNEDKIRLNRFRNAEERRIILLLRDRFALTRDFVFLLKVIIEDKSVPVVYE